MGAANTFLHCTAHCRTRSSSIAAYEKAHFCWATPSPSVLPENSAPLNLQMR
jgi:hypothetical protein